MRSLDECRAEVFARSEKRIAKRRKIRWRVTACLAPLCLCIVLLTILPMMSGPNKSAPMENEAVADDAAEGTLETQTMEALVRSLDGESWVLPEDQTAGLNLLLNACLAGGKQMENDLETGYEIEISAADGSKIHYFVRGRYLTCGSLTAELTEAELQQLLKLLQPVSE